MKRNILPGTDLTFSAYLKSALPSYRIMNMLKEKKEQKRPKLYMSINL